MHPLTLYFFHGKSSHHPSPLEKCDTTVRRALELLRSNFILPVMWQCGAVCYRVLQCVAVCHRAHLISRAVVPFDRQVLPSYE